MKTTIKYTILIVIFFLAGFLCRYLLEESPRVVTKIIPGDSVFVYKTDTLIKPVKEYNTLYDSIFDTVTKVDTVKILVDYYTPKIYKDTLQNDSSMTIIIRDSIMKNSILKRQSWLKNNRTTKIINTYTYNQNGLYLGGEVSLNHLQIGAMYLHNKNNFEIGINFINLDNKSKIVPSIGYKHLIWSKDGNN